MATDTVTVYAPNDGYAGTVGDIKFDKGKAEVPKDHQAMPYFRRKGYGIGKPADPPTPEKGPDARFAATRVAVGSHLRDAAVNPEPSDFLPPTNAGNADPHGPAVVAPEIHGSAGAKGISPGEVHVDDPDEQQKDETALAEAILVGDASHESLAVAQDGDPDSGNMGPLGLSDPGSVDMGVAAAKDVQAAEAAGERHGTALAVPTADAAFAPPSEPKAAAAAKPRTSAKPRGSRSRKSK